MIKKYLNLIKFEHSIFALPFALSGALLATPEIPNVKTIFFIILCAVSGRSFAMSVNRIIDKDIDSKNPRTKDREIPSGIIPNKNAIIFSIISLTIFILSTLQLPKICLMLLPVAALWFFIYPYTKRFTILCHLWLGVALGASVLAGWIAVTGKINSIIPFIIGLAVCFWVAGFDIIYACQDYEHDLENNIKSIPVKFGIKNALLISRIFHFATVTLLIFSGIYLNTSLIYYFGILFVSGMLIYEQSLVKPDDLSKVNLAFFTVNGWISIGYLGFVILEKLV